MLEDPLVHVGYKFISRCQRMSKGCLEVPVFLCFLETMRPLVPLALVSPDSSSAKTKREKKLAR